MNFITEFERGQLGENIGLPMGSGLKNLDSAIGGIQKGRIYGIAAPSKCGKCLNPMELVIMSDYSMKYAKDIVLGDYVLGVDGKPNKVTNITTGQSEMFLVEQSNAKSYIVNDEHLLSIMDRYGNIRHIKAKDFNKQTYDIRKRDSYGYKLCVPMVEKSVKIDPYYLGLWLGDGDSDCTNHITNIDEEVIKYLQEYAIKLNMSCNIVGKKISIVKSKNPYYYVDNQPFYKTKDAAVAIGISESHFNLLLRKGINNYRNHYFYRTRQPKTNPFIEDMRSYNLERNKHIPNDFLYNNEENRLKLLAGFIDTDGSLNKKHQVTFEIIQKNEKLIKQVQFLANSLGFNTKLKEKMSSMKRKDGTVYKNLVYRLKISGDTYKIPTLIKRKQVHKHCRLSNSRLKVTSLGLGTYCGFSLENNDKRFFLKDFTVTHNSTLVNYGFLYEPYLYALENNLPVEWIYYSFEIDRVSMEFDAAVFFLNRDYGIEKIQLENQKCRINGNDVDVIPLSPDYLKGMLRDTDGNIIKCKQNIIDTLKIVYENRIKKIFGEYNEQGELLNKGVVFFKESRDNPTGIYHELIDYAKHRGTILYKTYGTSNRMVGYNPINRNLTTIIIMDHIRKLLPERDYSTKQIVDKMMEYFVELRNLFGFTIIPIIHTNRSITETDTMKFFKDTLYPTSESVKDTGNISEDCNYLITMFNPNDERYNLSSHFGVQLKDKDGSKIYPYLRTLHLVESRHCFFPQHFRVNMYGNLKKFEQVCLKY